MDIKEAIGVCGDVDIKTGQKLSHSEIYGRAIEFLGGLAEVAKYIPFPLKVVKEKYAEDPHLNNLSIHVWDRAAGFNTYTTRAYGQVQDCRLIGTGICALYAKHKITSFSCSDGVCILKEAARQLAEGGDD